MSNAQFLRVLLTLSLGALGSSCCDSHHTKSSAPVEPVSGLLKIEVTPKSPSVFVGTTVSFTATGSYKDGSQKDLTLTATWSSSDANVATVGNEETTKGKAQCQNAGGTIITAAQEGVEGSTNLLVNPANLLTIEVVPAETTVPLGATFQFRAIGHYENEISVDITANVAWATVDPAIAGISNTAETKGLATALARGTTEVSATDPVSEIRGTASLTVGPPAVVGIEVTPANQSIAVGKKLQYKAMGTFSDQSTREITLEAAWSCADAYAIVSDDPASKGLATAVSPGIGEVVATDPATQVKGSTGLTITARTLESIQVTPVNASLPIGRTQQYAATGVYSDESTEDLTTVVDWTSSSPAFATIDSTSSKGLAHAVAKGKTTITATDPETARKGATDLTVTDAALESIEVTPANQSLPKGGTLQYTATGKFSDGSSKVITTQVNWSTAPAAIADISNAAATKGLATGKSPGNAQVTATDPATTVTGSTGLTVTGAVLVSIQVTPANQSLAKGRKLQYTATGVYSDQTTQPMTDQVDWSVDPAGPASISSAAGSKGLATALTPGDTTVTAADPVTSINGSTPLHVTAMVLESIEVTPANQSISAGRTQQYVATGTFSDSTTQVITDQVTWSTDPAGFADISNAAGSRGLLTARVARDAVDVVATDPATQVKGSTKVKITPAVLQSIEVTPANQSLPKGRKLQYTAKGSFSDGTTLVMTDQVTWSAEPAGFADISNAPGSKGLATATTPADAIDIVATDPTTQVKGSTKLKITPAVLESIEVTPADQSLAVGETLQYTATGTFSDQTKLNLTDQVTWGSSPAGIASVSNAAGSRGLAMALAAGAVDVTATDPPTTIHGQARLTVTGSSPLFKRCDSNQDGRHDIADGVWIIDELFHGGHTTPGCRQAMDCNRDLKLDLNDAIYCFNYFLKGGPRPPDPFPGCGRDPGETLTCDSYSKCQ